MEKKHLVVLTGAGMSAESGIPTFRGAGGLWEGYRIDEVATPGAWEKDYELVLEFYNQRRRAVLEASPNRGHEILVELEQEYQVSVVTQNIDDLHERAGSSVVVHLHGEIVKARSTVDPHLIYRLPDSEIRVGDRCEKGSQLRPHIVWFGEEVPMIDVAAHICSTADFIVVVGTSMQVYPAAGLIHAAPHDIPKFIIDPHVPKVTGVNHLHPIAEPASSGLEVLMEMLRGM